MAFLALTPATNADEYIAGEMDQEALRLLRIMSQSLPLRTTTLQQIAPEFVVAKSAAPTWSDALADANARFGPRQPQRAAFLRKYLERGSSEADLDELGLHLSLASGGAVTGAGSSKTLAFGPAEEPTATLMVWIAQGKLIDRPTLSLPGVKIEGVDYCYLTFDVNDRLISAARILPEAQTGSKRLLVVQENTTGEGGVNYYSASIAGAAGESESIDFTPDLVIKTRWVTFPSHESYHESYENGRLRKRTHNKDRQVANGTENYIDRVETFP